MEARVKRIPLKSKGSVDPLSLCTSATIDVVFGLVGLFCLVAATLLKSEINYKYGCSGTSTFDWEESKIVLKVFGIVCLFVILPLDFISVRYRVNRLVWAYAVVILLLLVVQVLLTILFFGGVVCLGQVKKYMPVLISSVAALFLFEVMCVMVAIFVAVKTKRYPA